MTNSSSDAAGTDLAKLPETTPEERAVLSAHIARRKQKRPRSPTVQVGPTKVTGCIRVYSRSLLPFGG